MTLWILVGATIAGCYLLKLAGYLVPARLLDGPRTRRIVELLPVALLAALVVVEAIADGRHLDFNGDRLAGVGGRRHRGLAEGAVPRGDRRGRRGGRPVAVGLSLSR